MDSFDRLAALEFGHYVLGDMFGPLVRCSMVGADGIQHDEQLPAAIAHTLWAIPDLCGVELFSLTIHHGHYIDDWGQSA